MSEKEMLKQLQYPFAAKDIEWRAARVGFDKNNKPYAQVLAYVTNRAIQQRLDEVVGISKWKNDFLPAPDGGVMCGISIKFGDEWVTKYDGAPNTDIEAVKGGLSNAMKRAAVQWGIGRYLYNLDSTFAECSTDKKDGWIYAKAKDKTLYWKIPALPKWALPDGDNSQSNAAEGEHAKDEEPQSQYKTLSKATEDDISAYKKEFAEMCKPFGITAKDDFDDFFIWLGWLDDKERTANIIKCLKHKPEFINQLETYKEATNA